MEEPEQPGPPPVRRPVGMTLRLPLPAARPEHPARLPDRDPASRSARRRARLARPRARLRDGDQIESIDGMIIHDIDSAMQAYARLGDATDLEVRVKRGSQWGADPSFNTDTPSRSRTTTAAL